MVKVKFIKEVNLSWPAQQRLWRVEQEGKRVHHVITSAVRPFGTDEPETYVFKANAKGKITNWIELPGSFKGDFDHERAIKDYVNAIG